MYKYYFRLDLKYRLLLYLSLFVLIIPYIFIYNYGYNYDILFVIRVLFQIYTRILFPILMVVICLLIYRHRCYVEIGFGIVFYPIQCAFLLAFIDARLEESIHSYVEKFIGEMYYHYFEHNNFVGSDKWFFCVWFLYSVCGYFGVFFYVIIKKFEIFDKIKNNKIIFNIGSVLIIICFFVSGLLITNAVSNEYRKDLKLSDEIEIEKENNMLMELKAEEERERSERKKKEKLEFQYDITKQICEEYDKLLKHEQNNFNELANEYKIENYNKDINEYLKENTVYFKEIDFEKFIRDYNYDNDIDHLYWTKIDYSGSGYMYGNEYNYNENGEYVGLDDFSSRIRNRKKSENNGDNEKVDYYGIENYDDKDDFAYDYADEFNPDDFDSGYDEAEEYWEDYYDE